MKKIKTLLIILLMAAEIILLNGNIYSQPTLEWVARYNNPHNSQDISACLSVDKDGNSYVTGTSIVNSTTLHRAIITVKYNTSGQQQWVAVYDDTTVHYNFGVANAIDKAGNVYVTGYAGELYPLSQYYMVTVKYNASGIQQWTRIYNGVNLFNGPSAIIVDKENNIITAGSTNLGGGYIAMIAIKYNTTGDSLWTRLFITPGLTKSRTNTIAIDSSNNVYIGGNTQNSVGNGSFATIVKYSSSGDFIWYNNFTTGEGNASCLYKKIATDRFGNIYGTGIGSVNGIYITTKLNPIGTQQWVRTYVDASGYSSYANDIGIDYTGNIYVTGYATTTGTYQSDFATIKYNSIGDSIWVRRYDNPIMGAEIANALVVDSTGNVYITGTSESTSLGPDLIVLKYTTNGIQQWVMNYHYVIGSYIKLDRLNNIYVTGDTLAGIYGDILTFKYSQMVGINNINSVITSKYYLYQNYPNPFNTQTNINYYITEKIFLKLVLYDIVGRELKVLDEGVKTKGNHAVNWDASNYPSGIYFYKLITSDFIETKKMVITK
ncbi:MAG: T9SS C-terminal target domain-containing protein [Ignavibacteriae bacterium]|nr:MAG: T9SS C-terminal target domain-containing protein [Ignavibacteriota bacterium]